MVFNCPPPQPPTHSGSPNSSLGVCKFGEGASIYHGHRWFVPRMSWGDGILFSMLYGADSCEDSAFPIFPPKAVTLTKHVHAWKIFLGVRDTGEIHTPKEQTTFNYHLCFLNFCSHVGSVSCPLPGQEPGFPSWVPSLCHPFPLCFFSSYCVPSEAGETHFPAFSIPGIRDVQGYGVGFRRGELCLGQHPFRSTDEATLSQV